MTVQSWRSLHSKKYQLTLRLFLFLNLVSSLFSLLNPIYKVHAFTLPLTFILGISSVLLLWHWLNAERKFYLPGISVIFGCLWAWHIVIKMPGTHPDEINFLIVVLLNVLFIGTIAFSNNIVAFLLHSLPVFITCLLFSDSEQWARMAFCLALPIVGISIQHLIEKRNDAFAQSLMHKLLAERETLNDLSMLDPLTGLYNRRGFQHRFATLMSLAPESHYVLLLDIDHFKAYNDHYGHMMGDQALIQVSAAVRDAVRSRDIVTRFGGEEFVVLLANSNADSAQRAAERIRQKVYDLKIPHILNASVATNVTISIGIAPLEGEEIDKALENADKALYEAKRLGRNHILTSDALPQY
ncbi:GGDEF domain-containing protein [Pseudocitrobacter vendiensis]|uniref:diguanylate cyclase n=1 Tax=Pseudocitrobacter vendiensis TaxID=2488306 RepID=A0ABN8T835_9ENTR|nr:GGDEF domain-containing protein [Pseudocitrobacter vendiensis]CAH6636652.1 Diguanylate cyclase (GGDEF) domain-containing protein [Pseudocitrobacter vendiensis]